VYCCDLLPVVRNHVYHPAFAGSFSLKAVLPAFVPDMTYKGMVVAGGQDAGLAWESLIRGGLDRDEHQRVRKALLDYCGQDTLALIKLVERLWQHQPERQRLTEWEPGDFVLGAYSRKPNFGDGRDR